MGKTYSLLTAVVLIWGFYYLAIDLLLESGWDPYLMNAIRFTLGGLLLGLVAVRSRGSAPMLELQKQSPGKIMVVSWLGVGLGISLMTLGQKTVDSGIAGVLGSTTPLFAALLGLLAVFGSKAIGKSGWWGVMVGLIGVTLLYKPWAAQGGLDPAGATLLLTGAFCFALEARLFAKWFKGADLLCLTALTVLWSAVGFILAFALLGSLHAGSWWLLIAMAILSNAVAYGCYLWLIQNSGPVFASLYAYLVPVVALIAGTALNSEPLTLVALLGSVACIAGAVLVGRDQTPAVDH